MVADVVVSGACGYLNINKISEGTAMTLLNLVYDLRLEDMNAINVNYPGIDLGDCQRGMMAFQITSDNSNAKILSSLKSFRDHNYAERFSNGIQFFIIGTEKKRPRRSNCFSIYSDIFNPGKDILYPSDLLKEIERLHKTNIERFDRICAFLETEFGHKGQRVADASLISFNTAEEKFVFYRKVVSGTYRDLSEKFVQYTCRIGNQEIYTGSLHGTIAESSGLLILGPSGCGKSILGRQLVLEYLDTGLPVVLEGKYYGNSLNELLNKEASAFGFESALDMFRVASELVLPVLIILDGFNECLLVKKAQLLAELEKLQLDRSVKLVITAQLVDPLFEPLGLLQVDVDFPDSQTKLQIASSYSGKEQNNKLESLLQVVSTSMEAKLIGEIGSELIESSSRFNLFDAFFSGKLGKDRQDGFLLLASIAKVLSDRITFSLSQRDVDKILRGIVLPQSVYQTCLDTGLLESNRGKISFGHEMYYGFFVAESIARFSTDVAEIILAINAPKNHDKKLLIVGSIEDHRILKAVLSGLTDVKILVSLTYGEGGLLCEEWMQLHLKNILFKIGQEIAQLEFHMEEKSMTGVSFVSNKLFSWTNQEYALIHVIPYLLNKGDFVKELFFLIEQFDERGNTAVKELWDIARQINKNVRYGVFASSYVGLSRPEPAITMIFSGMQSGFTTFYRKQNVPVKIIKDLLKDRSLKHGQFYFLLQLLRRDDKLQLLYGYAVSALRKWKSLPYHLFNQILDCISHFNANEEQRDVLIGIVNGIQGENHDPWKSTIIWDALTALGALENDAMDYIPVAKQEIQRLLEAPNEEQNFSQAGGIYNMQFDHPYDYAYQVAISDLTDSEKKHFYTMALKGASGYFFVSSLLIETTLQIGMAVCPLIVKWMEDPISEKTTPGESLKLFLLSHLIYGKFEQAIQSRLKIEEEPLKKSLMACGEVYYWINRNDLSFEHRKIAANSATSILFDPQNEFAVDSIYECRHHISSPDYHRLWENCELNFIEDFFPEACISLSHNSLEQLGSQKEVLGFSRGDSNVDRHAVYMLQRIGGLLDIDLLRKLTDDPKLGEAAVDAIKSISQKSL